MQEKQKGCRPFNIAMGNGPFIEVYRTQKWRFSMAMLNNQMVSNSERHLSQISKHQSKHLLERDFVISHVLPKGFDTGKPLMNLAKCRQRAVFTSVYAY